MKSNKIQLTHSTPEDSPKHENGRHLNKTASQCSDRPESTTEFTLQNKENPVNGNNVDKSISGINLNSGDSDDADSGIVTVGPSGLRVGSTSSTDTNPEIGSESKAKEESPHHHHLIPSHHSQYYSNSNHHHHHHHHHHAHHPSQHLYQSSDEGVTEKRGVKIQRVRFDDQLDPKEEKFTSSARAGCSSTLEPPCHLHQAKNIRKPHSYSRRPHSYARQAHPSPASNTYTGGHRSSTPVSCETKPRAESIHEDQFSEKRHPGGNYLLQTLASAPFERQITETLPIPSKTSKSQSCWSIETNCKSAPYANCKLSDSCTNVTKLCAIDPLESTDSMVCAFASVANVIADDSASEVCNHEEQFDKDSLDNDYIIEVKPIVDHLEVSDHLYETIYPASNSNCCGASPRTDYSIECPVKPASSANPRVSTREQETRDGHVQSGHSTTDRDLLELKSNVERPVFESKCKSSVKESSCLTSSNPEAVPPSASSSSAAAAAVTSLARRSVCEIDARRKSDLCSSIATATSLDSVRLKPDQVYPGCYQDTKLTRNSSSKAAGEKPEVIYAVISKESKSVSCNKKLAASESCLSSDKKDSVESRLGQAGATGRKMVYQSVNQLTTARDENDNPTNKPKATRTFLHRLTNIRRVFSKAFHADRTHKTKTSEPDEKKVDSVREIQLKSCQSVPALNQSDPQYLPHFKSQTELAEAKGSFVKSLASRMSLRRKSTKIKVKFDVDRKNQSEKKPKAKANNVEAIESKSEGVWGELKQLHSNGSQLIELRRPPGKPFGFFVARGTVNNVKGVFVSRIRDEETQRTLTGLLEIGDEIIAIDGVNVKNSSIVQVNQLIAHKNKIVLHVIPYVNHKYG